MAPQSAWFRAPTVSVMATTTSLSATAMARILFITVITLFLILGSFSAQQQPVCVGLENNLFALDLSRVKRDLELVPAIESADVERILPHTLKICVTEREPIAQFDFLL